MKLFSLKFKKGDDLRLSLLNFAAENKIQAGSIVTAVGALYQVRLRMAGAKPDTQDIRTYKENLEIVSLVGTISGSDCHLHISLADKQGRVFGGHLKDGSLVDLTAEIVLVEDETVVYKRKMDKSTGFEELKIDDRTS